MKRMTFWKIFISSSLLRKIRVVMRIRQIFEKRKTYSPLIYITQTLQFNIGTAKGRKYLCMSSYSSHTHASALNKINEIVKALAARAASCHHPRSLTKTYKHLACISFPRALVGNSFSSPEAGSDIELPLWWQVQCSSGEEGCGAGLERRGGTEGGVSGGRAKGGWLMVGEQRYVCKQ